MAIALACATAVGACQRHKLHAPKPDAAAPAAAAASPSNTMQTEKPFIPYSAERYKTTEEKEKYLFEQYGIIVTKVVPGPKGTATPKGLENVDTTYIQDRGSNDLEETQIESYPPKEEEIGGVLDDIALALNTYPPSIGGQTNGLQIEIAGEIIDANNGMSGIGGYAGNGVLTISTITHGHAGEVFYHEFFHVMDIAENRQHEDDAVWVKTTQAHGRYKGYLGISNDEYEGFAREYGTSAESEDQATMGEGLMNPKELALLMMRAKNEPTLLTRMQLITACKADPATGRFTSTMTEEEYKTFSGFDGYKYYRSWSPSMDHTFWNAKLDETSSPEDNVLSRNIYDEQANLLYYKLAVRYGNSTYFDNAGKTKLAKERYLKFAEDELNKAPAERRIDLAAEFYKKGGNLQKAQTLYAQAAAEALANNDVVKAAIFYKHAGNKEKAEEYAERFIAEIKGESAKLENNSNRYELFELCRKLQDFAQRYSDLPQAHTPSSAVALLYHFASIGINAVDIYEMFGEKTLLAQVALKEIRPDSYPGEKAKYYELAGDMNSARQWYIKSAQDDEARWRVASKKYGKDPTVFIGSLYFVGDLYRKGGDLENAKRCFLEHLKWLEGSSDMDELAETYRGLADLTAAGK